MKSSYNKSQYMAKGGIFTAAGLILVYLSGILPVNKTFLLALASFLIPLTVITTNIKNAVMVYISTAILSLLLCGIKLTVLAYIIFFGIYGIVKFYAEKLNKLFWEILIKLIFLNICTGILFLIYSLFFPGLLHIKLPEYLIIPGIQIVFLMYDYVLTLIINFIIRKLPKKDIN